MEALYDSVEPLRSHDLAESHSELEQARFGAHIDQKTFNCENYLFSSPENQNVVFAHFSNSSCVIIVALTITCILGNAFCSISRNDMAQLLMNEEFLHIS